MFALINVFQSTVGEHSDARSVCWQRSRVFPSQIGRQIRFSQSQEGMSILTQPFDDDFMSPRSGFQSQDGVSVQASCCSLQSRIATHTAEQHLKPEPNASCHRRSPRLTPWKVST